MRRVVVAIMASVAALALLAGSAAAKDKTQDRAFGSGEYFGGVSEFNFDARSGPLGDDPTGTFFFRNNAAGFEFEGEVTCLFVVGDTASITGRVTRTTNAVVVPEGSYVAWSVQDGDGSTPDLVSGVVFDATPSTCEDPPFPPHIPLDSGDIVVVDALCDSVMAKKDGETKCKSKDAVGQPGSTTLLDR